MVYFRKGGKLDNPERILNLTYEIGLGRRTRATDADILAYFTIGGPRLRCGDYNNILYFIRPFSETSHIEPTYTIT